MSPPCPTVVVRCDLGPSYGVGHLMRCIALGEELQGRGLRPVFLADAESVPFALDQLRSRGFAWFAPPASDHDLLRRLASLGTRAVVIDSYRLPGSTYARVRAAYPTLALVDGDPAGKDGDLLLDQNVGAEEDDWALPAGTRRLAGLRYALMRSEVREARARRDSVGSAAAAAGPLRVLAFFGGTDAFGAAPVVTQALVATARPVDLHVVGASPDLRSALAAITPGPGQRITVVEPTPRLMEQVASADVVLSAAGTSSWELLCLGAACGLVCVADNQRDSYDRVVGLGAVVGLGQLSELRAEPSLAAGPLLTLLEDPGLRRSLRRAGTDLVDGRGRERVVDALTRVVDDGSQRSRRPG